MTDRHANDPTLLDLREVARRLGISERACWQLLADGDIPHIRLGRRYRVRPAALEQWLVEQEIGGDS